MELGRQSFVAWGCVGVYDLGMAFFYSVSTFISFIGISCMYWDPEGRVSGDIE